MMGNVMRMATYDSRGNIAAAVPVLDFAAHPLKWYRLDDGVMGGQSQTNHEAAAASSSSSDVLHFKGTINTNGGGFTSIRSKLSDDGLPAGTDAIRMKFKGDGKTYKILLSDGSSAGSPFSGSPSWQADLPTKAANSDNDDAEEVTIPLNKFQPSFGPRTVSESERKKYKLVPSEMRQIGIMLSLLLSDGTPNPPETFGIDIFDFALAVHSMEPITMNSSSTTSSSSNDGTCPDMN